MEASERRKMQARIWWEGLKGSSNACFLPLYFDEHRYLVLMGGGGSGKSIFAGRKVLERVTNERGHRFLVCRKVARTLRDSCFAQLVEQVHRYYPKAGMTVSRSEMRLRFRNGSEILFAGLDDPEKLKSIYDITGIWVEEASELNEGDFNQLDIRLRTRFPYYLQMILTFNPISVSHWLKRRFFDTDDPRASTHRSTYKDNRFLPASAVETLEGFRLTDEYYYQVYCLGQWGVTGKTVFHAQLFRRIVQMHLAYADEPRPVQLGSGQGYGSFDRYNNEYGGAVWLDRAKLEVRSSLDENTDANVWRGRARFIAGFHDWRYAACAGISGATALS